MNKIVLSVSALLVLVSCLAMLTSCFALFSKSEAADAAAEEYRACGYEVVSLPTGISNIERSFTAAKYDSENKQLEWVQIFFVGSGVDEAYAYVKELFEIEKEKEANIGRDIQFGKGDGVIWFGTPAAVEIIQ